MRMRDSHKLLPKMGDLAVDLSDARSGVRLCRTLICSMYEVDLSIHIFPRRVKTLFQILTRWK